MVSNKYKSFVGMSTETQIDQTIIFIKSEIYTPLRKLLKSMHALANRIGYLQIIHINSLEVLHTLRRPKEIKEFVRKGEGKTERDIIEF